MKRITTTGLSIAVPALTASPALADPGAVTASTRLPIARPVQMHTDRPPATDLHSG